MLDFKQLRINAEEGKKFVVIGPPESRTKYLKDAENNPIMIGEHKWASSKSERYLGDTISQEGKSGRQVLTLSAPGSGITGITQGGGPQHHPLENGFGDPKLLKVILKDIKVRLPYRKLGLWPRF